MYSRETTEYGVIANDTMAGNCCPVGENHMIADLTIMGHMGLSHE
jgi:hypothetical protein